MDGVDARNCGGAPREEPVYYPALAAVAPTVVTTECPMRALQDPMTQMWLQAYSRWRRFRVRPSPLPARDLLAFEVIQDVLDESAEARRPKAPHGE